MLFLTPSEIRINQNCISILFIREFKFGFRCTDVVTSVVILVTCMNFKVLTITTNTVSKILKQTRC